MYPLISSAAIGIISGLIATALTIGFRSFWIHVVIPWFEERVYKDARIEGIWYCTSIKGSMADEETTYTATIIRHAHKVSIVMVCGSGNDRGQSYKIEGVFKNLILSATYESLAQTSLDRGAIALMLKENGDQLIGHIAFYLNNSHIIDDFEMIWFRRKEHFDRFLEQKKENKQKELAARVESQNIIRQG